MLGRIQRNLNDLYRPIQKSSSFILEHNQDINLSLYFKYPK